MKAMRHETKKKRRILTFEAEPEIQSMLKKAQGAGLSLGEILNQAMRQCGKRIIVDLAGKKAEKLNSLSFNPPELQLAGFAE